MWCPNFTRLTGLVHRLRYGCFDLPGERVTLTGALRLSLPAALPSATPFRLARLPIEMLAGADVQSLAHDGEGRLALAAHRLAQGHVIFLAYPLEHDLAQRVDGSSHDAYLLYRLLGETAGISTDYGAPHPQVQCRALTLDRDDLVIVQNRGWSTVKEQIELPESAQLLYDRGNENADVLGPKGARVYRAPRRVRQTR
jgi:hypothetical protein